MATLYEYYNTGNDALAVLTTTYWKAQSFTPAISHKITSVKLYLAKTANPAGIITVSIRATDGSGLPTGSDLASGTTDGDTLATPNEWREITFSTGYNLVAGTKYAIVVRGDGTTNEFRWLVDISSPTYANGSFVASTNSGTTWANETDKDMMFEDWGVGYSLSQAYIIG